LCSFSVIFIFASISQATGCQDHIRNELDSLESGVKIYSLAQGHNNGYTIQFGRGVLSSVNITQ